MSIVLDQLSKRYGEQWVVNDVSLEVADGELFVLLGASGSGKSTILRLIAGLVLPDSGRILLHGRDVTHLAPQPRSTGFVFQNYSIFRHMSAAQNIEFGLKLRKVPAAERTRRCEELLEMVGLAGLGDRYPDQLSGGQQQRVALARALAYEPSVLLLDEPLGALDVKIRAQLRRSLKEVQRRLGVITILVTHDQEEAFELGDRIGVLERGVLLEVGNAEDLYLRPKSFFVARFLGAGTVLVGRAEFGQARFGPLSLPIPGELPHAEGAPVGLLVRPEQVALSADRSWARASSSSRLSAAPCAACGCACRVCPGRDRSPRRSPSAKSACWWTPSSPPKLLCRAGTSGSACAVGGYWSSPGRNCSSSITAPAPPPRSA